MEHRKGGGQHQEISADVVEPPGRGANETMGGDSVPELLDGEVGYFELVAVGVEHLSLTLLRQFLRGHGGQRRGRG